MDAPDGVTEAFAVDLASHIKGNVVLVKLEMLDAARKRVSDNFYWISGETTDYRKLNHLTAAQLTVSGSAKRERDLVIVHVRLENKGNSAAIQTKLTLLGADGSTRVLPAYYGDNYVSLLPGESKDIDIEAAASNVKTSLTLAIRGWNVPHQLLQIGSDR